MSFQVQKPAYPTVLWSANNKHLVFKLFDMLETNDNLQRGIWPQKGDNVSGLNKVVVCKNITKKLLETKTKYKHLMTNLQALTHYENSVKNQLHKLKKNWKNAKETLRVTDAGLVYENKIWPRENEICSKWKEVKEVFLWYYRIKKLVEDRFDDVGAAITNRKTDVLLSDRQSDNKKKWKHTQSEEREELEGSEKSDDEELEELKEVGGPEEYISISGSDRRGNDKELDLEEILNNSKGNNEDDNDDTDIKVHNTRKSSSCQQTVIKTVTTTVPLQPEASTAPKAPAPVISASMALVLMASAPVATPLRQKANVIGDLTDGLE